MILDHTEASKPSHLISAVFIIVTYVSANLLDSILEGEDVVAHLFSPTRLLLLLLLVGCACYLLRLILRHNLLKRSCTLQHAAIESSIDGIAIFDEEGKVVYSNRAHTELYGYRDADEVVGQDWPFLYGENEAERLNGEVKAALSERGEWRGQTVGTRKDGSTFPQEVSLTKLEGGGIIGIVRDNTEKKSYEAELERRAQELTASNSELKTFSYSLSHDMRSHITRASAAVQLLGETSIQEMGAEARFLVSSITHSIDDMAQLVESIEVLSAISRSQPRLGVVNLSEMVGAIAAGISRTEPDREAEFVIAPGVSALCDANLARLALDNLLENAWKYTGKVTPARIEFGVERAGGKELLFIRDNGMGFDMAEAGKMFEPFLRLPNAKAFPGTGVGLATVQRVIQLHSGELWAVGEPGRGATFYFSFAYGSTPPSING